MRQIGTLPKTIDPHVFGDYLLSLGVTSRVVESKDGWAVWVHNEDQLAKASTELAAYEKAPDDPRYVESRRPADEARRQKDRLDRVYRKNVRDVSSQWGGLNARRRPLTVALVSICIVVFLAGLTSRRVKFELYDRLMFFPVAAPVSASDPASGLEAIQKGEAWRLLTPMFLHPGGWPHLIFNVWATSILGTLIETRRGTRVLAVLVLLTSVGSNVGEYLYEVFFTQDVRGWGGISGVVYGLFGYIWMRGQVEPEQGMILSPTSVRWMILWLLLGFTGFMPMANGAHVFGLVVGMLFGLARF